MKKEQTNRRAVMVDKSTHFILKKLAKATRHTMGSLINYLVNVEISKRKSDNGK